MDISTDFTFYCTKESGALLEAKGRVASPNPEKNQLPGQAEKAPYSLELWNLPQAPVPSCREKMAIPQSWILLFIVKLGFSWGKKQPVSRSEIPLHGMEGF